MMPQASAKLLIAGALLLLSASAADAQPASTSNGRTEAGGYVTALRLGEFDETDYGVGGRLAFDLTEIVAIEGQLSLFPQNLGAPSSFSRRRLEGLFGVRVGTPAHGFQGTQRLHGVGLFGTFQPGFVRFGPSPEPVACILIYPPPLTCTLAAGRTELAFSIGGGVIVPFGPRVSARVDVSDLLIHFNDPALRDGKAATSFTTNNPRIAVGLGFRF